MFLPRPGLCILASIFALVASDVQADRRGIRVDGFGDTWTEHAFGTPACPGTTVGSPILQRFGHAFAGVNLTSFLFDVYCQTANAGTLTTAGFNYSDEPGLVFLFGANAQNAIKGIRYSYLDRDNFDFENPPLGFQWGVYTFPSRISVVGLYGLVPMTFNDLSFISIGPTRIWDGHIHGYNGQYFCFRNNVYIGSWNGTLTDPGSACWNALLNGLFANGFQAE